MARAGELFVDLFRAAAPRHERVAGAIARQRLAAVRRSTSSRAATTCSAFSRRSARRPASTSRIEIDARCSHSPSRASTAARSGAASAPSATAAGARIAASTSLPRAARPCCGDRRLGHARRDDARRRQRDLDAAVVRQHAPLLRASARAMGEARRLRAHGPTARCRRQYRQRHHDAAASAFRRVRPSAGRARRGAAIPPSFCGNEKSVTATLFVAASAAVR